MTLFWNINGRVRFLHDSNILAWLNNFDIIFLSETHINKGQNFLLPGYNFYHNSNKESHSVNYGGISCFIKYAVLPDISSVNCNFNNHIIVDFKNNFRLFGSYIHPFDSMYFNPETMHQIPLSFKHSERAVIGGGDYNSRVGDIHYESLLPNQYYRKNPDCTVNSHGKLLIKILRSQNLSLLNNQTLGEKVFHGDFTYDKCGKKSQIDLCIANLPALSYVDAFHIHNIPFNFSDHLPISVKFNYAVHPKFILQEVSADLLTDATTVSSCKPSKLHNIDWTAYETTASINIDTMLGCVPGN